MSGVELKPCPLKAIKSIIEGVAKMPYMELHLWELHPDEVALALEYMRTPQPSAVDEEAIKGLIIASITWTHANSHEMNASAFTRKLADRIFNALRPYLHQPPKATSAEVEDVEPKYKANFLWKSKPGSIEAAGYQFANARTEEYRKLCWDSLLSHLTLSSTGTKATETLQSEPDTFTIDRTATPKSGGKYTTPDGETIGYVKVDSAAVDVKRLAQFIEDLLMATQPNINPLVLAEGVKQYLAALQQKGGK